MSASVDGSDGGSSPDASAASACLGEPGLVKSVVGFLTIPERAVACGVSSVFRRACADVRVRSLHAKEDFAGFFGGGGGGGASARERQIVLLQAARHAFLATPAAGPEDGLVSVDLLELPIQLARLELSSPPPALRRRGLTAPVVASLLTPLFASAAETLQTLRLFNLNLENLGLPPQPQQQEQQQQQRQQEQPHDEETPVFSPEGPLPTPSCLTTLHLVRCPSPGAVSALLARCPSLTDLDVRCCDEADVLRGLAAHPPPHLRHLALGVAMEYIYMPGVGPDEDVYEDPRVLMNGVWEDPSVNTVLQGVAAVCAGTLETLACGGLMWLTAEGLQPFTSATSLRSLQLANSRCVGDSIVAELAKTNPGLTDVNLRATSVSDDAARAIAASCKELRSFNCSCTRVSEAGILALVEGCPNLSHVDLCYPEGKVTQEGLFRAFEAAGPRLTGVGIGGIASFTDRELRRLVEACPNITKVGLGWCSGLTPACWGVLAQLPALRVVLAHYMKSVTHAGVAELMRLRPSLAHVDLFAVPLSPELTAEQLGELKEALPMDWRAWEPPSRFQAEQSVGERPTEPN